ncbi:DUF6541 family protein [Umezawaea endophytica]|uniref:Uncharacterized protein n=1 Tax=Umezawaea endophytica TaxID=1654476 RepID=A0A9X2VSU2_9PSEU|nr:DUF6541 family protein [Umezawaea endophytica]MCS7482223.1 hypothetical protein [Umezawaea endophytica]
MLDTLLEFRPSTVLLLVVTAVLLWTPGSLLAAVLGLRGWLLAGTAPVVTMGLVGLGAPLAPAIGLGWSTWFFLGWTLLVCLVAAGAVLLLRRRGLVLVPPTTGWSRAGTLTTVAAVVIAAGVAALTIRTGTSGLGSLPQGWDAPYHGNGIRFIAETGNSGNRAFGWIDVPDSPNGAFYPNAYHAFEALAYRLTGDTIPTVMNSGMLVTAALGVPLGTIAIVKALHGSAGLAAASALVSTSFASYPFDLWQWGQLYPYAAGLSLVLPFLALLVRWLDSGFDRIGVLVALSTVALVATHSAMAFVGAILGLCYLVQRVVQAPSRFVRRDLPRLAVLAVGAVALSGVYLLGALTMAGRTAAYNWPAVTTSSKAFGDAVLLGHDAHWPQWLLAAITVVGGYLLVKVPAWRWLLVGYLIFLGLFVVAAALDTPWSTAITAPWWNDRWRLVAVLVLPATIAAGWALQAAARRIVRGRAESLGALAVVGAVLAAGYLGLTGGYAERNGQRMQWDFAGSVVSDQERVGLQELGAIVRPGERVMNDGVDGTVWTYALSGVEPIIGHYPNPATLSPRRKLLLERFNQLDTDGAVGQVVRDLNIRYAVVTTGFMDGFRRSPGLAGLSGSPALRVRYSNPDFTLYEVDWTKLA